MQYHQQSLSGGTKKYLALKDSNSKGANFFYEIQSHYIFTQVLMVCLAIVIPSDQCAGGPYEKKKINDLIDFL